MPNPSRTLALLAGSLLLASACADSSLSTGSSGEQVRKILATDDPLKRAADLGALLGKLPPESLPELLEAFGSSSIDRGDTEVVLLATWWARFDPQAAAAWTTKEWTAGHVSVLAAVFRTWGRSDPKAAWSRARALHHSVQVELASDAVLVGWHKSGAPGLAEFIGGLGRDPLGQQATETLARLKVVELGAQGALEWAESLPDPKVRSFLAQRVAGAAAWDDPEGTARWAEARIDDGYRTSGLARRVATRWIRSDPEAAMAWLATLPNGGDRQDGVLEAYRDWQRIDRATAVAWIEGQPVEPWLEPALSLYARGTLQSRDPEAALALTTRFDDRALADTTATYVARSWIKRDREAADAWLQKSDLPEDVVRRAYMVGDQEALKRRRDFQKARREQAMKALAGETTAPLN